MGNQRRRRELLRLAQTFCTEAIVSVTRNNHVKILLTGPLGQRQVIAASTPSDARADLNLRSELRRRAIELQCNVPDDIQ